MFYPRLDAQQGLAAPKKGRPIFSLVPSFALHVSSLELISCQQVLQAIRINIPVFPIRQRSWCDSRKGRGHAVGAGAAGAGSPLSQRFQGCNFSDSPPLLPHGMTGLSNLRIFLREALRTVLKQKSSEAEPSAGVRGGLPSPQNICSVISCCSCLLRWGGSWAALLVAVWLLPCPSGEEEKSPRHSAVSSWPLPSRSSGCVQERHVWRTVAWSATTRISVLLRFQCLVLAGGSPNALSLLRCWNKRSHTCLQLDPLVPKQHAWQTQARKPAC